ncbi:hypothetical protein PLANPX_2967 [Lacipirellula parvula]|uniref:Uncharacterized protein n=1 Tax=Lacipirellula parvula TaxID=2650471 RepID=A0A5K7XAA1_9BACT|nr:hypothetical protein PLANPX_2967 [Lacipirellula parvula]
MLIRIAGLTEAVRRTIYLWPGNLIHAIVVVVGIVFLLGGVNLLSHTGDNRDR